MLFYSGGALQSAPIRYAPPWDVAVVQSVFFYLSGTRFERDHIAGPQGPLATHHPKLKFVGTGYPQDLTKVEPPFLALDATLASDEESAVIGSPVNSREKQFVLWGFAGSYQDTSKNAWEQSLLLGDCRNLLKDSRIPIYDFSSGTSVTQIGNGTTDILTAEMLPPNAPLAIESHKFQVTFRVEY